MNRFRKIEKAAQDPLITTMLKLSDLESQVAMMVCVMRENGMEISWLGDAEKVLD